MAENLHKLNIQTSIVEAASHVVNTLDDDMASILHNHIREKVSVCISTVKQLLLTNIMSFFIPANSWLLI
jgi:pyruvate/2-oxoglutarate dehydrogenase complex dihydrolipoamide dehydrogenase (E3) component